MRNPGRCSECAGPRWCDDCLMRLLSERDAWKARAERAEAALREIGNNDQMNIEHATYIARKALAATDEGDAE